MTRTDDTVRDYLKRAQQLTARYQRETGASWNDDPVQWVRWLGELRKNLKKASWRQYKSASACFLELNDDGSDEQISRASELLATLDQGPCTSKSRKTSARRLKKLSDEDLKEISGALDPSTKKHDRLLLVWLVAGRITGLRPHEWWQARLDGNVLVVRNSKVTNGRANGEHRYLDLTGIRDCEMLFIREMLHLAEMEWPEYASAYNSASSRLKRVTNDLWPRRPKRPTLYSARHQFRANASSAGVPLEVQGALMGHGSAETARRHYGRKRFGTGTFKVTPDPRTRIPEPPRSPSPPGTPELKP